MTGKVVRGSEAVVTDGPYAEAKDLVLGFIDHRGATTSTQAVDIVARLPVRRRAAARSRSGPSVTTATL